MWSHLLRPLLRRPGITREPGLVALAAADWRRHSCGPHRRPPAARKKRKASHGWAARLSARQRAGRASADRAAQAVIDRHPLAGGVTLWAGLCLTYLAIFGCYWLYNLAHLAVDLREAANIAHFTRNRLGLSEHQLRCVTWPEVARRIVEARARGLSLWRPHGCARRRLPWPARTRQRASAHAVPPGARACSASLRSSRLCQGGTCTCGTGTVCAGTLRALVGTSRRSAAPPPPWRRRRRPRRRARGAAPGAKDDAAVHRARPDRGRRGRAHHAQGELPHRPAQPRRARAARARARPAQAPHADQDAGVEPAVVRPPARPAHAASPAAPSQCAAAQRMPRQAACREAGSLCEYHPGALDPGRVSQAHGRVPRGRWAPVRRPGRGGAGACWTRCWTRRASASARRSWTTWPACSGASGAPGQERSLLPHRLHSLLHKRTRAGARAASLRRRPDCAA